LIRRLVVECKPSVLELTDGLIDIIYFKIYDEIGLAGSRIRGV
jgi:hypothetical protein